MIFRDGSPFYSASKIQRIFMEYNLKFIYKKALNMLCRQIFPVAPRKHLAVIDKLFWLSALFHWFILLQVACRSTPYVICSTSEACRVSKLAIKFYWVYVPTCVIALTLERPDVFVVVVVVCLFNVPLNCGYYWLLTIILVF